jgi:hypothetical protein
LTQNAPHTLLLDSIAEINARLRILDEANARLEAAVERQLELLELLITSPSSSPRNLRQSGAAPRWKLHRPIGLLTATMSMPEKRAQHCSRWSICLNEMSGRGRCRRDIWRVKRASANPGALSPNDMC